MVDEQKMLKWIINDKVDRLKHKSDPVAIDNYKFVFYAERNRQEYSGLKVFTSIYAPKDGKHDRHSRNENSRYSSQSNSYCLKGSALSHKSMSKDMVVQDYTSSGYETLRKSSSALAGQPQGQLELTIFSQIKCTVARSSLQKYKIETPVNFINISEDKRVCIAHLEDLVGVDSEREILIYLKIDYIQTAIYNEIRKENNRRSQVSQCYRYRSQS